MNGIEIKIEKGIPMPANRRHSDSISSNVRKMEVGDSFIWPASSSRASISQTGKSCGVKLSSKKQSDGSIRVWRVA